MFKKAEENRQKFARDDRAEQLVMADVLRRCERFEEAARLCEEGLQRGSDDLIRHGLELEMWLVQKAAQIVTTSVKGPREKLDNVTQSPPTTWDVI